MRWEDDLRVLAFRDFGAEPLGWRLAGGESRGSQAVERTMSNLLEVSYDRDHVTGVRWKPGAILVVDNWRALHGRTASRNPERPLRRHLKRLRLI